MKFPCFYRRAFEKKRFVFLSTSRDSLGESSDGRTRERRGNEEPAETANPVSRAIGNLDRFTLLSQDQLNAVTALQAEYTGNEIFAENIYHKPERHLPMENGLVWLDFLQISNNPRSDRGIIIFVDREGGRSRALAYQNNNQKADILQRVSGRLPRPGQTFVQATRVS